FNSLIMMIIGQVFLAIFLAILLGLGISYFQDILPDFPGYASTLFANAMVIGQLRSEEHTSELQSRFDLVCRLLLEKKKTLLSIESAALLMAASISGISVSAPSHETRNCRMEIGTRRYSQA